MLYSDLEHYVYIFHYAMLCVYCTKLKVKSKYKDKLDTVKKLFWNANTDSVC